MASKLADGQHEIVGRHAAAGGSWSDLGGQFLLVMLSLAGLIGLVAPTLIVILTSFDTRQFISFPPEGFSLARYAEIFQSPEIIRGARISAAVALLVVAINLLIGVPAGIALVRRDFPGKPILTAFLLSPIMLPGIVIGIAILFFYSVLSLPVSIPLMILSHVVITLPFMIRLTLARMEHLDPHLEEAAENLGAGSWDVFRYVIFPQLRPGIVAGSAFAFLASFDNLTVSLFTAPVLQRPLPMELFYMMRFDLNPVVAAVAALQFAAAFLILLAIGPRMGSPPT